MACDLVLPPPTPPFGLYERIETPATDDLPIETIRRWCEPHANLVNVETGGMAPLSLFWDMVFRPGVTAGGMADHLFFNSRAEAALWESDLQPISEWNNGSLSNGRRNQRPRRHHGGEFSL